MHPRKGRRDKLPSHCNTSAHAPCGNPRGCFDHLNQMIAVACGCAACVASACSEISIQSVPSSPKQLLYSASAHSHPSSDLSRQTRGYFPHRARETSCTWLEEAVKFPLRLGARGSAMSKNSLPTWGQAARRRGTGRHISPVLRNSDLYNLSILVITVGQLLHSRLFDFIVQHEDLDQSLTCNSHALILDA